MAAYFKMSLGELQAELSRRTQPYESELAPAGAQTTEVEELPEEVAQLPTMEPEGVAPLPEPAPLPTAPPPSMATSRRKALEQAITART